MGEEKELTVRQAGQKGGETTKRRHGSEFYANIGRKGGQQTKRRYGPDFYTRIGKKGGEAVRHEHGVTFYEEIGRKGGERVRRLIQEGRKALSHDGRDAAPHSRATKNTA